MIRGTMIIALVLALLAPATAMASTKPGITTGAASNVAPDSVTLAGKVDPNQAETSYFVQFGTTTLYGAQTPTASAGAGGAPVNISATLTGLSPATTYHYRLVGQNKHGIVKGADRTFKTKVQPLGIATFVATPNPVVPGTGTQLTGQLTGTNAAGRDVVLQANPWPYAGFATVGNPLVTDALGNFAFAVLSVPVNTQFRVLMPQKPEVVSPVVVVGAALQVKSSARKVAKHRRSASVRFKGSIAPGLPGTRMAIQRNKAGVWTTIATTRTQFASASASSYSTRVRLYRSGQYRVVAEADAAAQYTAGAGRVLNIKVRRR